MYVVYRYIVRLFWPVIRLWLALRRLRGKEHPERFPERLGHPGCKRPDGPLIWLHGASVGEAISMGPLVTRLKTEAPGWHVLVTTGTRTSADIVEKRLSVIHQFVPVDHPAIVGRFLNHWRPELALWFESELWPTLLFETAKRGTPLVLVQGRLSPKSYAGWRRFPAMAAKLLSPFSTVLAQSEADARRFRSLLAPAVSCEGNLKFAADPLPVEENTLETFRTALKNRPVWAAASTHPGEEALAAKVHKTLHSTHPDVLTLIIPRHPERGEDIADELEGRGLTPARRSQGEMPQAETDIYIADTIGEMGLFLRLSDIVFMGNTLAGPGGGQNPLEPARLNIAVCFGPDMSNFHEIASRMVKQDAARQVPDAGALAELVTSLLNSPEEREALARRGQDFASREAATADRVLAHLKPYLERKTES